VRAVIGTALMLVSIGIALGLLGALAGTRVLASFLYGVGATDPVTLTGVATVLVLVALIASYVPARRAARVDPAAALRGE
jgi:putative ABC transport system permease protein